MKRLLVLLLFTSIFYSQNRNDLVLFKINDSETTLEEFNRVYNKNIDLVEELNFGLILVCHLRRLPDKTGHEEGAITSLSHMRGSHGLAQLTDICCGLERSQQNEETKDILTIRVLKNRYTGDTGVACSLHYNRETGRLSEGDFSDV